MHSKDDAFLKKLLGTFKVEAAEHLANITSGLLELEKPSGAARTEVLETAYREVHSLKGAARSVDMGSIEAVCQAVESVFSAWKRSEVATSSGMFDVLHRAIDLLGGLLETIGPGRTHSEPPSVRKIIIELEKITRPAAKGGKITDEVAREKAMEAGPPPDREELHPPSETVRMSGSKLNEVMLLAEEMLSAKVTMDQRVSELREASVLLSSWKELSAKCQPDLNRIVKTAEKNAEATFARATLMKLFDYLQRTQETMGLLDGRIAGIDKSLRLDRRWIESMVDNFLLDMKKVLMLPCSSIFEIFPKLARDLSHSHGKSVNFSVQGAGLEIDRRVLEELKDPLMHLVRNSIDHGIEPPERRRSVGKPADGSVVVKITPLEGGMVEILVSDDGSGIDLDRVKASAVKAGLISQKDAEQMTDQDSLSLVYASGVSTSALITDISGRGLGLAIVREKIEKLGGSVSAETGLNTGTAFRLVVPVTLANFRGITVRVGKAMFVIPTADVEHVLRVEEGEIKTAENKETIEWDGMPLSLSRLGNVLGIPHEGAQPRLPALVIRAGGTRIAFIVDEVVNEQEVLVKGLGSQLARVKNIAGATLLANGRVAPVLNAADLLKSAAKAPAARPGIPESKGDELKSILVVEDSITARTLLKNILEAAGYRVRTAVDGIDALTVLKTETFDLAVSDVDMPRMNGLDLTAKIRMDKRSADLPVVLVSALGSREDRERGVEVGANAYIVKSSFDQSNLLEVIRRLLR